MIQYKIRETAGWTTIIAKSENLERTNDKLSSELVPFKKQHTNKHLIAYLSGCSN